MSKLPKGPWVWGHHVAGYEYPPEHEFHAALYAPDEKPRYRFVLEASSIGDGDAIAIKSLIAAAPDLLEALENLVGAIGITATGVWRELDRANAAIAKARGGEK